MLKKILFSLGMGGGEAAPPAHARLQGPLEQFQRDPMAAPVIAATVALLNAIVDHATGTGEAAKH